MGKIAIDIGHYKNDSGAVYEYGGKVYKEVDLVYDVCIQLEKALIRNNHSTIITSGSLSNRCKQANDWKADIMVSVHTNAGKGDGCEVYWYGSNPKTEKLAKLCLNNILEDNLNNSRGIKKAGFYVLKNSNMPSCLVECAFGDNLEDFKSIDTLGERQMFGEALAEAVCEFFGTSYKPEKPIVSEPKVMYRVVCGTYSDKENAIEQQNKLKMKGFDSFLIAINK